MALSCVGASKTTCLRPVRMMTHAGGGGEEAKRGEVA
jgi:hypothetical protein